MINHRHIYFTDYGVTIPERAVFSSSLEKPERSQYSICQSALEPFISTLCTYLEEKKTTHKYKYNSAGRAPISSLTTLTQPPTSLSRCTLGRTLCALGRSWDRAIPSELCTRQLHWIFSNLLLPWGFCSPWFTADASCSQRRNDRCLKFTFSFCSSLFLPVLSALIFYHSPFPLPTSMAASWRGFILTQQYTFWANSIWS